MKTLFLLAATLISTSAFADGFVCENSDVIVKVYNNTDPSEGTRNAAVMIVSDPRVQIGRKTIARFTDVNGTITNKGAHYSANVDLRFTDSARKGENIGGTKLGQLDKIQLDMDFQFGRPVANGASVEGILSLVKRDGNVIESRIDCVRYLKN